MKETRMKSRLILALGLFSMAAAPAIAQQFNPREGWQDSYAVDGVCYCNSNFDHGISGMTVDTPVGSRTVEQVCSDLRDRLGTGSSNGRIPYNTVNCGHRPYNTAADETGCPGRVDIGYEGCDQIGPAWDLEAVYGDEDPEEEIIEEDEETDFEDGSEDGSTASHNAGSVLNAFDGNTNTRWTTGTAQSPGQFFEFVIGDDVTVGSIVLDSSGSANDEPAGYRVETRTEDGNFQFAAQGTGSSNGITTINFTSREANVIRITQTGSKSRNWWSIHEMTFSAGSSNDDDEEENDNGGGAASGTALNRSDWSITASNNSGSTDAAIDGNRNSRWTTRQDQRENQWFEIDLGETATFSSIELDSEGSSNDFPRLYSISVSENGGDWETVANGAGSDATTSVNFGTQTARYVRIEQSGTSSIHEANLFR